MPVLFDDTITKCSIALRDRMEAFGEYQHFFWNTPALFERVASVDIVIFLHIEFLLVTKVPS